MHTLQHTKNGTTHTLYDHRACLTRCPCVCAPHTRVDRREAQLELTHNQGKSCVSAVSNAFNAATAVGFRYLPALIRLDKQHMVNIEWQTATVTSECVSCALRCVCCVPAAFIASVASVLLVVASELPRIILCCLGVASVAVCVAVELPWFCLGSVLPGLLG